MHGGQYFGEIAGQVVGQLRIVKDDHGPAMRGQSGFQVESGRLLPPLIQLASLLRPSDAAVAARPSSMSSTPPMASFAVAVNLASKPHSARGSLSR